MHAANLPMQPSFNRRQFLKTTAAAIGAAVAPNFIPAKALGKDGWVAPSERIVMGGIGLRGRGVHDLNWALREADVQFIAICDANREARERVKKLVDAKYGNTDCKVYPEMREFLATRPDLDALLIATGDRWHALAATLAMRAGKDVYSEKPSSMTRRGRPHGRRDSQAVRPCLSDRHAAAQRTEPHFLH